MSKTITFQNQDELFGYISQAIKHQQQNHDTFNIAISGGNSPLNLFQKLSNENTVDYSKTKFWQVDERFVDSNDLNSNQYSAKNNFDSNEFSESFEVFDTSLQYKESADNYAKKLDLLSQSKKTAPNKIPNLFDLTLLGFGIDGHFGSMFPCESTRTKDIEEWYKVFRTNKFTICTTASSSYPIPKRLTLSPKSIKQSNQIIVILIGKDKAQILDQFQNGTKPLHQFPANYWKDKDNVTILACLE